MVARRQLMRLEVTDGEIQAWLHGAYLFRRFDGVYAVGHLAPSVESDMTAALLRVGPGAMLSHRTSAWWCGLLTGHPPEIELSTPRRVVEIPGVTIYGRRDKPREWWRGLPVTTVAQTLIDLAAIGTPPELLRRALAEAEYRGWLDLDLLEPKLGHGVAGSAALRKAMAAHQPRLAMTRSEFENRLIRLCERAGLPLPECNRVIEGLRVDAVWRAERVVVELDGRDGHRSWAQAARDRRRDVILRGARYTVLRYVTDQFREDLALVEGDLARALRPAA